MQGPAGCGGWRRAQAGPDQAYWAAGRPQRGLAEWASSMERLIPARTKSLPVVLLDLQQEEEEGEKFLVLRKKCWAKSTKRHRTRW